MDLLAAPRSGAERPREARQLWLAWNRRKQQRCRLTPPLDAMPAGDKSRHGFRGRRAAHGRPSSPTASREWIGLCESATILVADGQALMLAVEAMRAVAGLEVVGPCGKRNQSQHRKKIEKVGRKALRPRPPQLLAAARITAAAAVSGQSAVPAPAVISPAPDPWPMDKFKGARRSAARSGLEWPGENTPSRSQDSCPALVTCGWPVQSADRHETLEGACAAIAAGGVPTTLRRTAEWPAFTRSLKRCRNGFCQQDQLGLTPHHARVHLSGRRNLRLVLMAVSTIPATG